MKKQIDRVAKFGKAAPFVDIHAHILPCMDDGSRSVGESLEMLCALREQGVHTIVATPHFYPTKESPADFLARRSEAVNKLSQAAKNCEKELPKVCLGAEVAYFNGICGSDAILKLRFEGTNTILIEMPFEKWSEAIIDEMIRIKRVAGLDVVVAHIERYAKYQSREALKRLASAGVLFQVNCETFGSFSGKRLAFSMMKAGNFLLLGTDCHDTSLRKPNMPLAVDAIVSRVGVAELEKITLRAEALLGDASFVL